MSPSRQPISVGQYFLERGKIDEADLRRALAHKERHGYKLGQSLVALDLVTEADLAEVLRHQARFPCIRLTPRIVDPIASLRLPEAQSRRHRAVVLNEIAGHTTVAMEDPTDTGSIAELEQVLGTRVFPVYAEATAIANVAEIVYGPHWSDAEPEPQPEPGQPGEPRAPSSTPETSRAFTTAPMADPRAAVNEPDDRKVGALVRDTLMEALETGATGIHLEPRVDGLVLRHRVDGVLVERKRVPRTWAGAVLERIKRLSRLDANRTDQPQDGRIQVVHHKERVELRVSTMPGLQGESAVLSLAGGRSLPRLTDMGLVPEASRTLTAALAARDGLVLSIGPAGCGKTTTLYALLQELVGDARKVVTIEDPVERLIDGALQIDVDPHHGLSFGAGVRSLLHQDPDVVLVGDLGDDEACQQTVRAASSTLVLAGIRARGVREAVRRLLGRGVEPMHLADTLHAFVDQRLLRRVCEACKAPARPDAGLLASLGIHGDGAAGFEGAGCSQCRGTGFRGRVGIHEVTCVDAHLRRWIEQGAAGDAPVHEDALATLRADGLRKARAGLTTLREVLAATSELRA